MEASAFIKQEDGVETAKICRWCLTEEDALEALTPDESGQYNVQKIFDFTDLQIELSPGVPSYLCTTCESRLEKMDRFRWRCNENNDLVDKFIKQQNTPKNVSEIAQNHLDQSAQKTIVTELSIKTEISSPDATKDLHLNQRSCTVPQLNGTHESCGNQPFEAEENPITIKLEYVDVDELYRLQTNALLDHEQDDLRTNPLELVCQDRENHSISNNICGDGTELLIHTKVNSPDAGLDLHLNQKCFSVHQANRTYECCGKIPDDLFEAEENPIAIKSEYEEVDEQDQLQTMNDGLNHEQDNLKSQRQKRKHQCPHCSSCFAFASSLKIHIRTHTGERPYVCKVCDKSFYSSFILSQHSKIHNKDQHHQCPHCSSMFAQLFSLKNHIRTHTGERPYVCKVCDKAFRSSASRVQHSKIHNKDQQHQCPQCSSSFAHLSNLKIHIRTHTGERPYQCKVCHKAFYSSSNLAKHSEVHNKDKQHKCPHCSSMFSRSSNLKRHIRTHTGEKPYQCKVCDKAFRSRSDMTEHSRMHNKDQQYRCPHCSSRFAHSSSLTKHIRTHTGERPYQCKVCHKAFYSSSSLATHSKIHNKDRQHQCPHCSSMFAQLATLKNHLRTHTGEKPYQCKVCDKAFSHSSNLAYHSKIHKNVEHH